MSNPVCPTHGAKNITEGKFGPYCRTKVNGKWCQDFKKAQGRGANGTQGPQQVGEVLAKSWEPPTDKELMDAPIPIVSRAPNQDARVASCLAYAAQIYQGTGNQDDALIAAKAALELFE